jgi:hypothetical protein
VVYHIILIYQPILQCIAMGGRYQPTWSLLALAALALVSPNYGWYFPPCSVTVTMVISYSYLDILLKYHDISHSYCYSYADISRYFTIFHDISPYFTIFHHISSYFTIFHHISPYFTIFHHISPYFTIFHHISPYFTIFHHISPYFTIIYNHFYLIHIVVISICWLLFNFSMAFELSMAFCLSDRGGACGAAAGALARGSGHHVAETRWMCSAKWDNHGIIGKSTISMAMFNSYL